MRYPTALAIVASILVGCSSTDTTTSTSSSLPNLTFSSIDYDTPVAAEPVVVTVTVINSGAVASTACYATCTVSGSILYTVVIPALDVGGTTTLTFTLAASSAVTKAMSIVLDSSELVDESSETDNSNSQDIIWPSSADG